MKTIYEGDDRYEKIKEQMDLLSITDVTTERQVLNGTIVWRLPYKSRGNWVEYGAFASGYVRNQGNQCHSNWQINKRVESEAQYYPDYVWCDKTNQSVKTGKFNRYYTKKCVTIPIEIDRLEYLMKYIVKNEFIKRAKMLETDFVPKWKYDDLKKSVTNAYSSNRPPSEIKVIIDGHRYNVI
tara:strand:+ start:200 stop:745 length:546 start_codon:yes stop_codon:yes gene_type:complete